jgi:hypothetical protein
VTHSIYENTTRSRDFRSLDDAGGLTHPWSSFHPRFSVEDTLGIVQLLGTPIAQSTRLTRTTSTPYEPAATVSTGIFPAGSQRFLPVSNQESASFIILIDELPQVLPHTTGYLEAPVIVVNLKDFAQLAYSESGSDSELKAEEVVDRLGDHVFIGEPLSRRTIRVRVTSRIPGKPLFAAEDFEE